MSEFEDGPDPDLVEIPSSMASSSLGGLDLNNNTVDDDDAFTFYSPRSDFDTSPTIRRTSVMGSSGSRKESHRQSLAFELAAAMDPDQSTTSSLLSALGIEEEEEEDGDVDDEGMEESLEGFGQVDAIQTAMSKLEGASSSYTRSPVISAAHMMETPSRGLKTSPGTRYGVQSPLAVSSTAHTSPLTGAHTPSPIRFDTPVIDEPTFDMGKAALERSIATTHSFLGHLQSYNTSQSMELEARIERLVGDAVKTMTEQTKAREGQVRELKEIESWFAKVDRRILADLEAIPELEPDHDDALHVDIAHQRSQSPTTPLAHRINHRMRTTSLGQDSDDSDNTSPPTPSSPSPDFDLGFGPEPPSQSGIRPALSQLRSLTSDLVGTLSNISEHTQVSRAASTDVGRKLKSVKAMTVQWTREAEALDMSSLSIDLWEREEGLTRGQGVSGRYKTRMLEATSAAQQLLEDAHRRAILLLTPASA